jgi:hypothetical protein
MALATKVIHFVPNQITPEAKLPDLRVNPVAFGASGIVTATVTNRIYSD